MIHSYVYCQIAVLLLPLGRIMTQRMIYAGFFMYIFSCKLLHAGDCDIRGIDKADLVRALYRRARPRGDGWRRYNPSDSLSDAEVQAVLNDPDIYYLKGRVMKIDLTGNTVNTSLYNQENGIGRAEKIIADLRS